MKPIYFYTYIDLQTTKWNVRVLDSHKDKEIVMFQK